MELHPGFISMVLKREGNRKRQPTWACRHNTLRSVLSFSFGSPVTS